MEYIQANNTNMTIGICSEYHSCSNLGCNYVAGFSTCSCDNACEHFEDCCWDYQSLCQNKDTGGFGFGFGFGFGMSGYVDHQNMETMEVPDSVRPNMVSCVKAKTASYWFVTRCPSKWNSSDTKPRCEDTASFTDDLLTIVPVSLERRVTFRNVYCAICHGFQSANLTSWPVLFNCSDGSVPPSDTDEMLDRIRRGVCTYTFDDKSTFRRTPAYRECFNEVRSCPENFADDAIADACVGLGLRAPLTLSRKMPYFFNEYCLKCNLPDRHYSEFTSCFHYIRGEGTTPIGFPISLLVDFKGNDGIHFKVDENFVQQKTVECEEGAVFDILSGICRSLSCRNSLSLLDGECTWAVGCNGNRVGIEFGGLNNSIRECALFQENQGLMKCLTEFLGISLDDVSLVRVYPDVDQCIAQDVNPKLTVEVQVDMSYSTLVKIINTSSRGHLCGASVLQFQLYCSDEDIPCQFGWMDVKYGQDVSEVTLNKKTHLIFRGHHAAQKYKSVEVRRTAQLQRSHVNATVSIREVVQFCVDRIENATDPVSVTLSCPIITMNASEFRQLHIENQTILVHLVSGMQFNESEFGISKTGSIQVCSFSSENSGVININSSVEFLQYSDSQSILSTVCVTVSLISLVVTLSTHIMFPSLRKLTNNKLMMFLCVFLFLAQILTVVGSYAYPFPILCKIVSATTHFCWLAVFATTNSLAFDLHHTFGYNRSFNFAQTSLKSLIRYLVYIPGVSFCVVIPCLCIDAITHSEVLDYSYGGLCWIGDDFMRFMAFGIPMAILLAINLIFFFHTALGIWKGHQNARKVGRKNMRPSFQERFNLLKIYIKIVDTLTQMSSQHDNRDIAAEAATLLAAIKKFEYLVALSIASPITGYLKGISSLLQGRQVDIIRDFEHVTLVQKKLQKIRSEELDEKYLDMYNGACQVAEQVNVSPSRPRTCGQQILCANPDISEGEDIISAYYRVTITVPILDHLLAEFALRCTGPKEEKTNDPCQLSMPCEHAIKRDSLMYAQYFIL
ncbi:uncharacterized protein LOC135154375 [Lytechinus pictus]|uniref:uncharacterized protein LOC135154375 n=1 Tax=Lytechinus pictus TaxID=7653 RepID=UPI0030B9BE44